MNDLIACACASAGYSIIKEPIGLFQSRQEAPERSHARPWQSGKALCWEVTVICPLAESYVSGAQPPVRPVPRQSSPLPARKRNMPTLNVATFSTQLRPRLWAFSARQLMSLLAKRIAEVSGEARQTSFLFQRCSVLVQPYTAVWLHDSLTVIDCAD